MKKNVLKPKRAASARRKADSHRRLVMAKDKTTLKDMVKAAHDAGATVSVSLKPKETSLDPLRKMVEDLTAVLWLAESRNIYAIKAAHRLADRVSRNDVMFLLTSLEKEYWDKPPLERP